MMGLAQDHDPADPAIPERTHPSFHIQAPFTASALQGEVRSSTISKEYFQIVDF